MEILTYPLEKTRDLSDFSDGSDHNEEDELNNLIVMNEVNGYFDFQNIDCNINNVVDDIVIETENVVDNIMAETENIDRMLENPTITYKYHRIRKEDIKREEKPLTTKEIVFTALPKKNFPRVSLPTIERLGKPSSSPSSLLIPVKSRNPRNIDDPTPFNEIRYNSNKHFAIYDARQHATSCRNGTLTEWNIHKKNVSAVVTVNGANMVKSINDQFESKKEVNIKKLILDVKTIWDGTFYNMLDRFLILSKLISDVLIQKPSSPEMLTARKLQQLRETIKLFEKIEKAIGEVKMFAKNSIQETSSIEHLSMNEEKQCNNLYL
ncbi:hypothetical protein AGLY_012081 [Aphis glycines]|uniref:Uncharacterized protein n=1 Tax=Aphis glycines TaxID=307491 RepID=A0A6G0T936_APHGL|nr:hypothetical protein AGLY_012081 [Aphis glycines]